MDDFLVKPFDTHQMAATLLNWLEPRGTHESVDIAAAPEPTADLAEHKTTQGPIVDLAVIESLRALDRKGMPSRLARAVTRFMDAAPPLAATIRESCEKEDTETMWRTAHSLKSSAGALGARLLAQHCAEIESAGRHSGLEEARPIVAALDMDLTTAIDSLRALIDENHVDA